MPAKITGTLTNGAGGVGAVNETETPTAPNKAEAEQRAPVKLPEKFKPCEMNCHNTMWRDPQACFDKAIKRAESLAQEESCPNSPLQPSLCYRPGMTSAMTDAMYFADQLPPKERQAALARIAYVKGLDGDTVTSIEHFKEATALDPEFAEPRFKIGVDLSFKASDEKRLEGARYLQAAYERTDKWELRAMSQAYMAKIYDGLGQDNRSKTARLEAFRCVDEGIRTGQLGSIEADELRKELDKIF